MFAHPLARLRRASVSAVVLALAFAFAGAAEAQQKFAVIDIQKVLGDSATGKAAQARVEAERQQKQAPLETMANEIQDLTQRLEAGKLSLAQDKLAELAKEREDKIIALKRAEDDANRDLQVSGERTMRELEAQILPVINQVGKDGGYTMIFNKFQSGLIYADQGIDITAQVISLLDQQNGATGG